MMTFDPILPEHSQAILSLVEGLFSVELCCRNARLSASST